MSKNTWIGDIGVERQDTLRGLRIDWPYKVVSFSQQKQVLFSHDA